MPNEFRTVDLPKTELNAASLESALADRSRDNAAKVAKLLGLNQEAKVIGHKSFLLNASVVEKGGVDYLMKVGIGQRPATAIYDRIKQNSGGPVGQTAYRDTRYVMECDWWDDGTCGCIIYGQGWGMCMPCD